MAQIEIIGVQCQLSGAKLYKYNTW